MKKLFRRLWHDLYYAIASEDSALRCKEVAEQIDLHDPPHSLRFWLHLSLCQACANYLALSRALGRAVRRYAGVTVDVERLNQELLKKYAKEKL